MSSLPLTKQLRGAQEKSAVQASSSASSHIDLLSPVSSAGCRRSSPFCYWLIGEAARESEQDGC